MSNAHQDPSTQLGLLAANVHRFPLEDEPSSRRRQYILSSQQVSVVGVQSKACIC